MFATLTSKVATSMSKPCENTVVSYFVINNKLAFLMSLFTKCLEQAKKSRRIWTKNNAVFLLGMGSTSSTPGPADASASVAVVTHTPTTGCPVQHSSPATSISECPAHQGGSVKLQASQCPIGGGTGCESAAIDNGSDALDPTNMVKSRVYNLYSGIFSHFLVSVCEYIHIYLAVYGPEIITSFGLEEKRLIAKYCFGISLLIFEFIFFHEMCLLQSRVVLLC